MISPDAVPRVQTIGILSDCAVALLMISAWLILTGGADYEMHTFPPLLIGMVLLFMALALLALRAINRRQGPAPPQP